MQKKRRKSGFTLAELLIAVAIIGVLSGVAFVAVAQHQRNLAQLERDAIAKEIFIAAQNHLTTAEAQGFLGATEFGSEESTNLYYFVVPNTHNFTSGGSTLLDLMLPFGSIDETVRAGGSYLIRYQRRPARILDVYYSTLHTGRFDHTITSLDDAQNGYGQKNGRVGHYGGDGLNVSGETIEPPVVQIFNEETLKVEVDASAIGSRTYLTLIITGETSGAKVAIPLISGETTTDARVTEAGSVYTVVLDDITDDDKRFRKLYESAADANKQPGPDTTNPGLLPGENITVQAVAYSANELTNIAYSNGMKANSLYADVETVNGGAADEHNVALIANMRHLENLDDDKSGTKYDYSYTESGQSLALKITEARQAVDLVAPADPADADKDLSWQGFIAATNAGDGFTFQPISPSYALTYMGQGHAIEGVVVAATGSDPAGLFGELVAGSAVSDLQLIDFSIASASGAAGALAGSLTNANITNVVAYTTADNAQATAVTSESGNAGGLVGTMTGGKLDKCAAALYVKGGTAGGLVGSAANGAEIASSYSGGHTRDGAYSTSVTETDPGRMNVIATGSAGGLVGQTTGSGTSIHDCYSTCSARGLKAGGLVGEAAGAFRNCYATGLVTGTESTSNLGAFAGVMNTGSVDDKCRYFGMINGEMPPVGSSTGDISVAALDGSAEAYNDFVGDPSQWRESAVYDDTLSEWYGDRYCLGGLGQLGLAEATDEEEIPIFARTHYGDWPIPDTFVINLPSE